jgi:hypothetical protein
MGNTQCLASLSWPKWPTSNKMAKLIAILDLMQIIPDALFRGRLHESGKRYKKLCQSTFCRAKKSKKRPGKYLQVSDCGADKN